MDNPDVIALVDRDTDGRPDHPMIGQRLRPQWIDLEDRPPRQALGLRGDLAFYRRLPQAQRGNRDDAGGGDPEVAVS